MRKKVFHFDYEIVKKKVLVQQIKPSKFLLGKEEALGSLFRSFNNDTSKNRISKWDFAEMQY